MAAIARVRLNLQEDEFWRLTPRQLDAYLREWAEGEKRKWKRVKFLATACAHAAGHDVDYMEEPEEQEADPDRFRAWLDKHRAPKDDGETDQHNDGGTEGAPGADEADGDCA